MSKLIKRGLIGVLILITGFIVLLVFSVLFDYIVGKDRILAVTNTTISTPGDQPDVLAYVARPEGSGPFPAVIMIHEFYGLNESIVGKADGLAQEGYLVIAPDTFRGSTTAWIPRAIYQVISTDNEQVNFDLDSIYTWLENQPDVDPQRIAIAGFCYGGRAALSYSLHNNQISATVIFYGSPETDSQILQTLNGPVLGIFGGADNSIALEDVQAFESALNEAGVPNEISIYPDQPHAFVTTMEAVRQGGVQGQAWQQMLDFLKENLQSSDSSLEPEANTAYALPLDWGYYIRLAFEHMLSASDHAH